MARSERYAYWRSHGLPASAALSYARTEESYAATRDRFDVFGTWRGDVQGYSYRMLEAPAGYRVFAWIADDDEPYDWGDIEPTEEERAALHAFAVGIVVCDEISEVEVYVDSIGSVDAIDLPGYITRTEDDAFAYALHEYLLDEALDWIDREVRERSHWAARDTVTV